MKPHILSKLFILVACLSTVACGSEPAPGEVKCTGVQNCRSPLYAPACGDIESATCNRTVYNSSGTLGLSAYQLVNSPTCACIEGTVQYCRDAQGKPVQTGARPSQTQDCVETGAKSTSWGGCHS